MLMETDVHCEETTEKEKPHDQNSCISLGVSFRMI